MVNDFLEIHKGWIRESNLIENVDSAEADEACWNAFRRFSEKPINRDTILRLHWDVMIKLDRHIAGQYRQCPVWVGGRKGADWKRVPQMMNAWIERSSLAHDDFMIKRAHIEFERIHPFADGNGRVGRIIMNTQRLKSGLEVLVIYAKDRFEYYKWFTPMSVHQMGIRT